MASPGNLVEYIHNKKLLCALCISCDRKDQLTVRTEENREDKVAKNKLVLSSNESLAVDSDHGKITEWLRSAARRREEWAEKVPLQDLWELTSEESRAWPLQELGDMLHSPCSQEQLSGLYRALERDRVWFVRKGQDYAPRSADQVSEIQQRLAAEEEKAKEREHITSWLRDLWNDRVPVGEFDKAQTRYLNWIREVALFGNEAPRFKEIQALFKELEIGGKDAPFRFMLKAKLWGPDEFLQLHRAHPPMDFSAEILDAAQHCRALLEHGLAEPERPDLRQLEALTIDDAWTSEVDDALTLEILEDGYRVGVHIADASHFVQPGSLLDEEALERGTTIYLPERKIRMLPDVLGDELCSLVAGQDRLAFSFLIEFDADLAIRSRSMQRSKIRVARRWTYEEADACIDQEPLATLYRIALSLREQRQKDGAITLPFARLNVRVEMEGQEPQIHLTRDASEAPAQVLVSEMMILANATSGQYLCDNSLPALFRSQPEPEKPIPADLDPTPENLYKMRRLMKKGEVGLEPARHSGLGIAAYTQSTSPIRRYVDLIAQRQLLSHLGGADGAYTLEQLEPLMQRLERTTTQAEQLERERKQYWTLRYLEQRRWAEFDAVVLQNFPDKHWVQLIPVAYECESPQVRGRPMPPGTRFKARIEMVWPREGTVRVTPILDDED